MTQYSGNNKLQVGYGLTQALQNLSPVPIIAKRAPGTNDMAQLGTLWVEPSANTVWVLASIVNNSSTWIDVSGGAGVFSSLTVNPGPTNLSTVGVGAVTIGNSGNTAAITLASGSGGIALVGNAHTIAIGNDAAANTINIGSSSATAVNVLGPTLVNATGTLNTGIGSTSNSGTISIGNASSTNVNVLGPVNINVTGALNTAIASTSNSGTVSIGNSASGAITVTSGTGNISLVGGGNTINIANDAATNTVNIATAAAAQSVTIGSTNTSSFLTLKAGIGGLSLLGGQILNSKVTAGSAGTYVVLATDQFVGIDAVGGAIGVTLPSAPVTGRFITIADATGHAGANHITITGSQNISSGGTSGATAVLTTNYQSINLWFNGTIWNGQIIT